MAQTIYRDSRTGEIVTEDYAKANPATTQKEIVRERFSRAELYALEAFLKNPTDATDVRLLLERTKQIMNDTP